MVSKNLRAGLILLLLSFALFSGCIGEQSTENTNDESTVLLDYAKIILDKHQVNVSQLIVGTAVRKYIVPGDNKSGLFLTYLDGFQPYAENDAGTFYHVHGRLTNVAGEQLENVTITALFTNTSNNDLEIIKTKKFPILSEGVTHNFDIHLYDNVEFYNDVNYVIIHVTVGKK